MATPLYTIYIPISTEITEQTKELFNKLDSKYRNKYLKDQLWTPHIGLLTTQVTEENSQAYLDKAEITSKDIKSFEVILDLILPSPDEKYIWINVNQESKKKLIELHELFRQELDEYRDKSIPQYFQKIWNRIPEAQKMKIHQTGGIHDYFPHLSIVKLEPKQTRKAIREIDRKQFMGKVVTVDQLKITKQSFDEKDMFPVVRSLNII